MFQIICERCITRGYGNACSGSTIPLKTFCTNDFETCGGFSLVFLEVGDSCDDAAAAAVDDDLNAEGPDDAQHIDNAGGHCSAFRPLRSATPDLNILRSHFCQFEVETVERLK